MLLEEMILIILTCGMTFYVIFGGADFGAGIWIFNSVFRPSQKERDLIYRAMGPVWEANHVWLIFVLIGLHTAFPTAFAAIFRALWLPLLLGLVGIVFRGVGFAFSAYAGGMVRQQAIWKAIFAIASTMTPFFLGISLGAIASGQLAITAEGRFTGDYFLGWISAFSVFAAFYLVLLCTYLAAVYLAREARQESDDELVALWQRRALATGMWMGIVAMAGVAIIVTDTPELWDGFVERAWPIIIVSVLAGTGSLLALEGSRFMLAATCSTVAVASVIGGWVLAQYPMLIPPAISVATAKAPQEVLRVVLWGLAIGGLVIVPSFGLLLYFFKGKRRQRAVTG